MTRSRAHYCLVQYCPDAFRAEAANVGVLLFCPERRFLDARMVQGADRPSRFFGRAAVDRHALDGAKRSFQNLVEREREHVRSLEDLEAFLARFGNALAFTKPRAASVDDPERELEELFHELVGGRNRREGARARRVPALDAVFARYEGSPLVERDKQVVIPRIDVTIEVPYAYTNGRLNLVRPTHFGADEVTARRKAEALLLEGRLLAEAGNQGSRQVVLAVGTDEEERESENRVARLFDALGQKFVPSHEVSAFADGVANELAAHVPGA